MTEYIAPSVSSNARIRAAALAVLDLAAEFQRESMWRDMRFPAALRDLALALAPRCSVCGDIEINGMDHELRLSGHIGHAFVQAVDLESENAALRALAHDTLGEGRDCFPERQSGDPPFWWRKWYRARFEAIVGRSA